MTEDTAARLQELEDRAAIADVVNRYGDGLMRQDVAQIASCFAADAHIDGGPGHVLDGIDEIVRFYAEKPTSAPARLKLDHWLISTPVMSNIIIELDGDTAHCVSMCLAIHAGDRGGGGVVIVRGTRNIDDLIRTPGGWKIRRRSHPSMWSFEVPGRPTGLESPPVE
jgi:hypothetical protein